MKEEGNECWRILQQRGIAVQRRGSGGDSGDGRASGL